MRRGDLFVLSWESLRRVEWGKVSYYSTLFKQLVFKLVGEGWKIAFFQNPDQSFFSL